MWLLSEMCKDLNVWTRKFMGHCDINLIGMDECWGFYCSHMNCTGQKRWFHNITILMFQDVRAAWPIFNVESWISNTKGTLFITNVAHAWMFHALFTKASLFRALICTFMSDKFLLTIRKFEIFYTWIVLSLIFQQSKLCRKQEYIFQTLKIEDLLLFLKIHLINT